MVLDLITLIILAVIYILEFPLGALLCSYVPMKLSAAVNVILGVLGVLGFIIFEFAGGYFPDTANFLLFLPFYIYIPNLILYFKIRGIHRRCGTGKEKYSFKKNAGMAAILTVCSFPIVWICFVAITVMY